MNKSYVADRVGVRQLAPLRQIASGLLTLEVVFWIVTIAANA